MVYTFIWTLFWFIAACVLALSTAQYGATAAWGFAAVGESKKEQKSVCSLSVLRLLRYARLWSRQLPQIQQVARRRGATRSSRSAESCSAGTTATAVANAEGHGVIDGSIVIDSMSCTYFCMLFIQLLTTNRL